MREHPGVRARGVSVVVPVFNGAATLPELARRVDEALAGSDYELVLVNDGSADRSWETIAGLARANPRVRGLDLMRNYGQHNALLAGIRAARGSVVVTIDDDLQNPPEEIPKLLARLEDGADVVYGTAATRRYGFWRGVATRLSQFALRMTIGNDIAGRVGPFRAFRADLSGAFAAFEGPYVSLDVLLNWGASRYDFVPVEHAQRSERRSSYSFGRLATHALNVLTGFSTRPLRIASLVGLAFTLFGVAILVLVVVRYFVEGDTVPGFPFLASIIAIFSGVQLLTLGVIGEYLARMHVRVTDRPAYAVRQEVGTDG
jgi:glycosyltransferase involved in cell wall biosynthesis